MTRRGSAGARQHDRPRRAWATPPEPPPSAVGPVRRPHRPRRRPGLRRRRRRRPRRHQRPQPPRPHHHGHLRRRPRGPGRAGRRRRRRRPRRAARSTPATPPAVTLGEAAPPPATSSSPSPGPAPAAPAGPSASCPAPSGPSAARAAGASAARSSTPRRCPGARRAARSSTADGASSACRPTGSATASTWPCPADDDLRAGSTGSPTGADHRTAGCSASASPRPRVARRLRRSVGLPERDGLLVRGVEDGSPPAAAGLAEGDLSSRPADRAAHERRRPLRRPRPRRRGRRPSTSPWCAAPRSAVDGDVPRRRSGRTARGDLPRRPHPPRTLRRHGWIGTRHQGDHRGVLRQPRHRHRQVRRLPRHRLVVDAGRERPLGRRHRQPGAAAARRPAGQAEGHADRTRSATGGSATSGPSSSPSCCSASARSSPSTRASTSSSTPSRSSRPSVAIGILVVAIVLETFSLPHRHRGVEQGQGRPRAGRSSSAGPRSPSCPSCCSRTSAPSSASCSPSAPSRPAPSPRTRVWDGYGTLAIGALLGIIAIVLAVEMKSLLIGEGASPDDEQAIRDAIEASTRGPQPHPPADRAPRPRGAAGRRQGRVRGRPHRRRAGRRPSTQLETTVRDAVPGTGPMYVEPDVRRAGAETDGGRADRLTDARTRNEGPRCPSPEATDAGPSSWCHGGGMPWRWGELSGRLGGLGRLGRRGHDGALHLAADRRRRVEQVLGEVLLVVEQALGEPEPAVDDLVSRGHLGRHGDLGHVALGLLGGGAHTVDHERLGLGEVLQDEVLDLAQVDRVGVALHGLLHLGHVDLVGVALHGLLHLGHVDLVGVALHGLLRLGQIDLVGVALDRLLRLGEDLGGLGLRGGGHRRPSCGWGEVRTGGLGPVANSS